ncbi:MAG: FtsX-like permease family protein [Betaproteobacteria bacterium]|nr:FtsX-like permease family protein [Betaproteobacteria bacterium]
MTRLAPAALAVVRAVAGGGLRRSWRRALVAMFAIATGVALGYAVELVNRSAVHELESGLATLAGDADLEVRGPSDGFDEALYAIIASDPSIAVASPVVEIDAAIAGHVHPLPLIGVDVFRAAAINPALIASAHERLDTLRSDTVFVSPAAARWLGVHSGDRIDARAGSHSVRLRVVGLAGRAGSNQNLRYGVMDIAGVQQQFDRIGRLTRIDLRMRPGVDRDAVIARLRRELPPGVAIAPPSTAASASSRLSRAYRVNLDVLALVALFTGAMLVFATQALSLTRRRPQFALLRTLGLSRRRLVALVVGEAALLGIAGSVAGLAIGYAVASYALRHFGADLGAGYFRSDPSGVVVDVLPALMTAALGVVAAIVGGAIPAREAAGAAPAAALKAGDPDFGWGQWRAHWPGVLVITLGAVAALLPAIGGLPIAGYASIALLLVGTIMVVPPVAQAVMRALPAPRSVPAALALARLRANPGQIAVSAAAMISSVSLMVAMAIMVTSFRQSFDDWLAVMLPADLYLRAGAADSVVFSARQRDDIAGTPGVARAEFMRATALLLDPARPRVALLARDIDPRDPGARLAIVGTRLRPAPGAPPPVWISEALANAQALAPGSVVTLPLAGRNRRFTVAGIWRDYARQQGAIVVERSRYVELTGDDTVNQAALWLAPGARAADVVRALAARLPPGSGELAVTAGDLRRRSLAVFDRTFAVTYALEAAAVAIGLVALSAALVAQTLARRREFGVLRHLGMTRGQISKMLAFDGALTGVLGIAVGLLLGFAISLILVQVVNRQSFHWGMELHLPWAALGLLSSGLIAATALTGLASARGATREDAVRAVRADW